MFLKKIIYVIFFVYSKVLNASSLFELNSNQSKVMISISAIWEGKDLKKENLKAMTKFRKNFSHIPLIQFLNPAYFTKDDSSYKLIKKKINNVISQDDIIGLHIHPWKSLIENSKVAFRQTPSYWGRHINLLNSMKDFGHDVPLSVYSQDEIYRIIKHSLNLLKILNIEKVDVFMAGGWMGSPHVIEAVKRNGFEYDASVVDLSLIREKIDKYPLYKWIENIYAGLEIDQPNQYNTLSGQIKQIPNNGGLLGYNSTKEIFNRYKSRLGNNSKNTFHFNFAFYQEKAFKELPELVELINDIENYSKDKGIDLVYVKKLDDLLIKNI